MGIKVKLMTFIVKCVNYVKEKDLYAGEREEEKVHFILANKGYSERSLLIIESILCAICSLKPANFSTTIPSLLMTKMVGTERTPNEETISSPAGATG